MGLGVCFVLDSMSSVVCRQLLMLDGVAVGLSDLLEILIGEFPGLSVHGSAYQERATPARAR